MSNSKQRRAINTPTATTRDGFANFTARMGLGAQNVLSDSTYIFNQLTRNRMKLEAMYRGSWIVGAAVDAIAEDMTRAGISIKGDSAPEKIEQMQVAMTRLGVWHSLLEVIKWGRLYGGAVAMIVIDGQDPSTPLNVNTVGRDQFRGLKVFDRWQLRPSLQNMVLEGMDYGLPEFYDVISNIATGQVSNLRLHHSRVIRQIGIQLPAMQAITEEWWGESVIERMYDRLVSFDAATAGAANLIQKAHLRTVQIDKLREVLAAGGKAEENLLQMFHHMRMLQTNEGLTLLDKEDTFQAHSYTFSGLSDMILQFGQQIAGATGIPLVRLFGQSPAGLNSTGESDLRMYYDNVAAQQESRLRDGLMRVLQVMHQSLFGTPAPQSFDFDFVPLWQTSSKEKADIATAITTTVSTAFEKGIIDQATALQELKQSSESTGVFSNITQEEIDQAKTEPPPMPIEGEPAPAEEQQPASLMDRIKAWLNG
jgi:phage-related protein (TIGR01555 family)